MQQVPENLSADDLHQWLHGCQFFFRTANGDMQLANFVSASDRLARLGETQNEAAPPPVHSAQLVESGEIIPILNPSWVYCFWPEGGAVNLPAQRFAIYVERLPRKQWKRSCNVGCYSYRRLGAGSRGFDQNREKHNTDTLRAIVNPTYYAYKEARGMLDSGWASVAVNPQLTLVGGELLKVYFQKELVGKVLRDNTLYLSDYRLRRYLLPNFDGLVG